MGDHTGFSDLGLLVFSPARLYALCTPEPDANERARMLTVHEMAVVPGPGNYQELQESTAVHRWRIYEIAEASDRLFEADGHSDHSKRLPHDARSAGTD